jgi:hypothetical protein
LHVQAALIIQQPFSMSAEPFEDRLQRP